MIGYPNRSTIGYNVTSAPAEPQETVTESDQSTGDIPEPTLFEKVDRTLRQNQEYVTLFTAALFTLDIAHRGGKRLL